MANEEQVNILKQGAEAWNAWREEHPDERPNFIGANLIMADLSEANLQGADFCGATLRNANLSEAILRGADLSGADLHRVDFYRADLNGVNLRGADLSVADFCEAILSMADMSESFLLCTNLSGAEITGVTLYGTARDDWVIDGIQCDYVYWNAQGKQRTPKDRNFRPGEFEELYKQFPTFEYYFEHGFTPIDAVVMDQVVQGINERHPEFELRLKNFEATGTPHATLTVIHNEHVESAKTQLTADYEARLVALEGKQEQMMELFAQVVNNPQLIVAGDLTIGNKRMIQTGRDYLEQVDGDVTTGEGAKEHKDTKTGESYGDVAPPESKTRERSDLS